MGKQLINAVLVTLEVRALLICLGICFFIYFYFPKEGAVAEEGEGEVKMLERVSAVQRILG